MAMVEMGWVHRKRSRWVAMMVIGGVVTAVALFGGSVLAQTFSSGSTGADGAFAPTCTPTPCTVTVPLPPTGIFNFTTINIPTGVTVKFTRNAANAPVTMLASGNVTIAGTIDVSGSPGGAAVIGANIVGGNAGAGGPGGFDGGTGGNQLFSTNGGTGLGPGGGTGGGNPTPTPPNVGTGGGGGGYAFPGSAATPGGAPGGAAYGTPSLLPLIGGSGGGGGGVRVVTPTLENSGGGGGGGGALMIASSGTITFTGSILAKGGQGGTDSSPDGSQRIGGGGSGGAVRLVATTITGAGGAINVSGGVAPLFAGGEGSVGRIRLETFTNTATITFVGVAFIDKPGVVALPNAPGLAITAVAGVAAPASPTGSFTNPDITIPASTTNPMTIALAASNIPLGTTITVTAKPLNGTASSAASTALAGTLAASMATASLTIPTNQPSVISASATFTLAALPGVGPIFAQGEEVERVRVGAVMGGATQVTYITKSGREVPAHALAQAATGR